MVPPDRRDGCVGRWWADAEGTVERRGLKHRATPATGDVPVAPPLAELLDRHIKECEPGPGGRLFVTRRGPGAGTYLRLASRSRTTPTPGSGDWPGRTTLTPAQ